MTRENDELASAYVDDQVTAEDRRAIENDPDIMARVAELGAVASALDTDVAPQDELLRGRQISTALDAFDSLYGPGEQSATPGPAAVASGPSPGPGPIVDLSDRRAAGGTGQRPKTGHRGVRRWLGIAAGVMAIAVGGSIAILATSSGDDNETASVEAADAGNSGEDSTDAAGDDSGSDEAAAESAPSAPADTSTTAPELTAAAEADADRSGDDEAADAAEQEDTSDGSATGGGLFPDEEAIEDARVRFVAPPSATELDALADGLVLDPELSACSEETAGEGDEPVVFWVPVEIDGIFGEALFRSVPPGADVRLVDSQCQPIE